MSGEMNGHTVNGVVSKAGSAKIKPLLDESLVSTINAIIELIDSTQKDVLIPTLLQDNCEEYDAKAILNAAFIIKSAITGKKLIMVESNDENCNKTILLSSDGDNLINNITAIVEQVNSLKKSLVKFRVVLEDLKNKYEECVHTLVNRGFQNI